MFGMKLDLKRYEEQVSWLLERPVVKGKILFYGDSFFTCSSFINLRRRPENPKPLLEEAVRMKDGSQAIVNHGFGGSAVDDLLYHYYHLVRPYEPRALFLHVGSNDAVGFAYSPAEVMDRVGILVDWFQHDFPGAPVYLLNRTPALKTKGQVNLFTHLRDEYNQLMEWYCATKPGVKLIRMNEFPFLFEDPADIGSYDKIREDLHDPDGSHLNAEGYRLLMEWCREFLDKEGLL